MYKDDDACVELIEKSESGELTMCKTICVGQIYKVREDSGIEPNYAGKMVRIFCTDDMIKSKVLERVEGEETMIESDVVLYTHPLYIDEFVPLQ